VPGLAGSDNAGWPRDDQAVNNSTNQRSARVLPFRDQQANLPNGSVGAGPLPPWHV